MGSFWQLVTHASRFTAEVEAAGEHGFGINLDIFEANLINLLIVGGLVFYFLRGMVGKILGDRQAAIQAALGEAEKRQADAAKALAEQQKNLAQAQAEAEKIRASAVDAAKASSADILAKAQQDIQRMRESAQQDLNSEQDRVLAELRQRVVSMALNQAQSELPGRLNESVQQGLIERSIVMLGGS